MKLVTQHDIHNCKSASCRRISYCSASFQVLIEVSKRADAAEVVRDSVERAKNAAQAIVKDIQVDKAVAEEKLEAARPALEDAEAALNTIQPTHIGESLFLKKQNYCSLKLKYFQREIF